MQTFSRSLLASGIAMALFIVSCSSRQQTPVSEEGRKACFEEVGINVTLANQNEKLLRFRECLLTIDARLAAQRKRAAVEEAELQAQKEQDRQAQLATWASPSERLKHCKLVQNDVIELDKARVRAQARVISSSGNPDVSQAEAERYQRDFDGIMLEIDRLIPPSMRADWQPLDAVSRFKRCDPAEFGLSTP